MALNKNYKMFPDLRWILCWILPCAQPISLVWTDPRSRYCFQNCFKGLTFWILNKIFKKRLLCLLFWVFLSIIKLAQNTIVTTTSKLNLSLNASHIHYTHHFLRRCQVQVLDTFRYAANEFYSQIFLTVYSRLLI